jgi:hypothetical protein
MTSAHRTTPDLSGARWRTSTYSGGNNECVQIADNIPHLIPIRDSKHPAGPVLTFPRAAWQSFVTQLAR